MSLKTYKKIFEQSTAVKVVVDRNFIIVTATNEFLKASGTERDLITGHHIFEVFPDYCNKIKKGSSISAAIKNMLSEKISTTLPPVTHFYKSETNPNSNGSSSQKKYWRPGISPILDENNDVEYIILRFEDVTEQEQSKHIQEQSKHIIEDSNNRYYRLLMNSPYAVSIVKGEDMVIDLANELSKKRLGIEEDIIGKSLLEVLPEIKNQPLYAVINKVYTTGVPYSAKETLAQIINKETGELEDRYFDIVLQPFQEPDDTISGVTSIAYEVTEKVNARKRSEEKEHRYRTLIEESPIAIALYTGPEIRVQYANHIMQNFWADSDTAIGRPLIEVVPELKGQKFLQVLQEVYNTGKTYTGIEEEVELFVDGKLKSFYFNITYTAMRDRSGEIYGVLDTAIDVTEEVLAKKALEENDLTLRRLLDTMPQKISQADTEGNVLFFNQQWMDETGLSMKELQGMGWVDVIHPQDFQNIKNDWVNALRKGLFYEVECRIYHQNLGYRWNLSRAVPIKDEDGKLAMWVASCTDIHEQKAQKELLEKAIKERTKELEQANNELILANKELESFAYVSSHDLQEPLRKIQTFAGLIREKEFKNLTEKGMDYFHRMEDSADRMRILINDLLSFSRINNTEKVFETIDLKRIIEDVKEDYKELIVEKGATIEITELCEAKIIVFQFRQLMKNLISNSLKFSKSDAHPHIVIESKVVKGSEYNNKRITPEKNYCNISIKDNGIGFDPNYSDRIFEVFQRLHNKEHYPGSGIGLAIVKKVVDNHDGTIIVTSKPNKGARFDIFIPAE